MFQFTAENTSCFQIFFAEVYLCLPHLFHVKDYVACKRMLLPFCELQFCGNYTHDIPIVIFTNTISLHIPITHYLPIYSLDCYELLQRTIYCQWISNFRPNKKFFCAVTIEEFQVFINLSGIHLLFEYWKPVLYNIELLYTNTPTCQLQKPFIT